MTFVEAVKAMENGAFVRRSGWSKNIKLYAEAKDGQRATIYAQIDSYEPEYAIFRLTDVYGDDWYVIDENNTTDDEL